jgi:hypothetical protein
MKSARHLSAVAAFSLFFQPGFAQKLVDPNTVAPEFRAAAEKRRPEQLNLNECVKKWNLFRRAPRILPRAVVSAGY